MLLLGAGGEFAFIVIGLALTAGVVAPDNAAIIFTITTLSMLLLPLLDILGRAIARHL